MAASLPGYLGYMTLPGRPEYPEASTSLRVSSGFVVKHVASQRHGGRVELYWPG